jgi:hypothetical protein
MRWDMSPFSMINLRNDQAGTHSDSPRKTWTPLWLRTTFVCSSEAAKANSSTVLTWKDSSSKAVSRDFAPKSRFEHRHRSIRTTAEQVELFRQGRRSVIRGNKVFSIVDRSCERISPGNLAMRTQLSPRQNRE